MAQAFTPANRRRRLGLFRLRALASRFSCDYWAFFYAALCMDLGFGLFIFLFNLYLIDLRFDERFIGRVIACFTLGNVAGTIPAIMVARRYGLRPLLLLAFSAVPLLAALRIFFLGAPSQLALAFVTGAALCGWPICFSPAVARFTNEKNRAAGFSLAFAAGIGLGALAGIAGGYLPELLNASALHLSLIGGIRVVLVAACVTVALGILPLRRLSFERAVPAPAVLPRIFHPYLFRFLPAFVLWNAVTGSFPLFGAVYLQKALGFPLGSLGAVFGASQFMQFIAVLGAPLLFRRTGTAAGVALAQLAAAALLFSIAETRFMPAAICFYVLYFAAQFMCEPGIYQFLMERIPESEQSSASAFQNLSGALCQAGTAMITGTCIVTYGYHTVLVVDAALAVAVALLFGWLGFQARKSPSANAARECAATASLAEPGQMEWMIGKAAE